MLLRQKYPYMALSFDTHLSDAAKYYLKSFDIPVTASSFGKTLTEHPYYPSLYSLSATFSKFNIDNNGFRIPEEQLLELPLPFIAYMRNQSTGNDFVVVTTIDENRVTFRSDKRVTSSYEAFIKDWKGIVFLAQPDEKSGEFNYQQHQRQEKDNRIKSRCLYITGAAVILLPLLNFIASAPHPVQAFVTALLILSGLAVSVMLTIHEIDKSNPFIKKICTAGVKTDCDAILHSKGSRVFGITWSEIGLFYFSSFLLYLLLPMGDVAAKMDHLNIASIAAAGYIPYSIYYQYKIARQWCPLCLLVQTVLFVQLLLGLYFFELPQITQAKIGLSAWPIIFSLALPPFVWYTLKPFFTRSKDMAIYEAAYKRLSYNPDIFNTQLLNQPTVPDGWDKLGIEFGNPDAQHVIIKVCNPYCNPCTESHHLLKDMLKHRNDIKLRVLYTASNHPADRGGEVIRHFMALYRSYGIEETEKMIDEWYSTAMKERIFKNFAEKYPIDATGESIYKEIDDMHNWCAEAAIAFTPTFFLNGKLMPETYNIVDLKHIL